MTYGRLAASDALSVLVDDLELSPALAARIVAGLEEAGCYLVQAVQHGTRACYTSGWPVGQERPGKGPGCHCYLCRAANAEYHATRRARQRIVGGRASG